MFDKILLEELKRYVEMHLKTKDFCCYESASYSYRGIEHDELEDYIKTNLKPTFKEILFDFIDKKGLLDSDVYKRAGIDRRHFSKIRTNPDYRIGKNTVVTLGLALELDEEQIDSLLSAAGYSLSHSDTFDLVIRFCIKKRIYNIYDVNNALDFFSLEPLSGA